MNTALIYIGLFTSAFLAATLLPAQSEAGLAFLLSSGEYHASLLIIVASLGNIAGACVNWYLGYKAHYFKTKKWFPFRSQQLDKATRWFQKFGVWTLFLSWLPIIGDPITFLAGLFHIPFSRFLILVTLAKTGRYLVIASLVYLVT